MYNVRLLPCAVFVLVVCFSSIPESTCQILDAFSRRNNYLQTLTVDWRGGPFRTIQSAIDRIPSGNRFWTRIYVRAGEYREQVHIPVDKPYIYLQGEERETLVVTDGSISIAVSPTLISEADNIVVSDITFMNSHNYPLGRSGNTLHQAPAAAVGGDKCAFYRCTFVGVQDTLWDKAGRHYFKSCIIQGAVDFIFGSGRSIYEDCSIFVVAGALNGSGFITSQGREAEDETNGYVFKNCNIFGNGMAYLGRPWRPFARVLFYNTTMSNIVEPQGWASGNYPGQESTFSMGEIRSQGPGGNTARRVPWEYKYSDATVNTFTSMTYIDTEGWMESQNFNLMI